MRIHRKSSVHPLVAVLLLACLSGIWGCGKTDEPVAATPLRRVILLSCDTLSAKHLQAYGYDRATTAAFDSLATQGVLFKNCLAPQGWTLTSHMSMFTGLAPGVHRVGESTALAAGVPTLAGILRTNGFATGAFPHSNQWLATVYGFARGFDKYQFAEYKVVSDYQLPADDRILDWVGERAPHATDGGGSAPFFLFLHHMDVHSRPPSHPFPYWTPSVAHRQEFGLPATPPGPFLRSEPDQQSDFGDHDQWDLERYDAGVLRDGYDACVKAWDEYRLRSVLTRLQREGYLEDTLVIITADHGEEIAEHGGYYHGSPYGEVREVPLLMIWPGRLPAGAVVEQPVSLLDLLPTILDFAEIPAPEVCQGVSLRPVLEDPAAVLSARDFLVDGVWRDYRIEPAALVAEAEGRWWSLVVRPDTTGTTGNFVPAKVDTVLGLFDLAADPDERRDLQAANPGVVAELRRRIEERMLKEGHLALVVAQGAQGEEIVISPEARRRLKALGY